MVIVYESKTGFTKKYADMLSGMTSLKSYPTEDLSKIGPQEEIIFLGWMKVGKIQGLSKARTRRIIAVCGSGTGRTAEPDLDTEMARNKIEGIPFFYLRGGCHPLSEIKGLDKLMLSMLVRILKKSESGDEKNAETIYNIENGFDGVREENLEPIIDWLNTKSYEY